MMFWSSEKFTAVQKEVSTMKKLDSLEEHWVAVQKEAKRIKLSVTQEKKKLTRTCWITPH
jgi:hypothetical protein